MTLKYFKLLVILLLPVINVCNSKPKSEPEIPPNIVWITSEDNSVHYMSLFNEHGADTPNIERLTKNGLIYTHAFSNAPVCSAARSTLISGSFGPRLGTHYHRKMQIVPLPQSLKMFPYYLKKAGYHTTNNAKEDYNIIKSDSVWDMSSKKATWKSRAKGQPFFHVVNFNTTHESRLHFKEDDIKKETTTNIDSVFVQPSHPQTPLFKYTVARYHDKIGEMDKQVGKVIDELEKDGLLENTFIFYYGDHGGVLPGSKGYVNEMGLHVPLVVHIPQKYAYLVDEKPGTTVDGFVSFIDFGPTVLNLAGVEVPKQMDGKPFLGKGVTAESVSKRDETFGYADRFDEKYDMVRSLRKGKYKYERNYQTFNHDGLMNNYRYKQLGYQEWKRLFDDGKLNKVQSQFFLPKDAEYLYDVEADPYQTKNLAKNPEYIDILEGLRNNLTKRVKDMPDLSFYPEFHLINKAFDNPVAFGQSHKNDIAKYIDIANFILEDFESVKPKIESSLNSTDPWERYWAIITCSNFSESAKPFIDKVKTISEEDTELINRVRAAEFLGLIKVENPVNVMTNALYNSRDVTEAVLILNSMALMHDTPHNYNFNIESDKLDPEILKMFHVENRLKYLGKK
ncbi:sulfatase [Flavobacteriaceae bacterium MHTCC 0001]